MTTRIYLASELYMAEAWRELRHQQIDIEITSSWIDYAEVELTGSASPEILEAAWARNKLDIRRADIILVYGAAGDTLRGALVEAGMGLGMDKTIIIVGSSKSFGTWFYHADVYKKPTVIAALELARELFP